ncbi:NAD(P)H-hydrate epimerase [Pseudooceanicola sp.]|uniref:NAD(P)H-hydrate epimerase n=1 Tax=Pseudooceanicola sp. TaxID=1914328 RepID=UPI0035C6AB7B
MLTSSQMRDLEARAIASGEVSGAELMERAGAGVVAAMLDRWPGWDGVSKAPWAGQLVAVLAGPGNNGGDGYVITRLLAEAGAEPRVFAMGEADRLPPDAARARNLWSGPVVAFEDAEVKALADEVADRGQGCLVVVDALFGIGQRAPLDEVTGRVWRLFDRLAGLNVRLWVVAVDLPTGYDADSGEALAARPLPADLTVTFHQPKPIHGMPQFLDRELVVHDIGI